MGFPVTFTIETPLILKEQKDRITPNSTFEKTIKSYPPIWKNLLREYCDSELINKLESCKNFEEAVIVTTQDKNPDFDPDELDAWLKLCMWEINRRPWDGVNRISVRFIPFYGVTPNSSAVNATAFNDGKGILLTLKSGPATLAHELGHCATNHLRCQ